MQNALKFNGGASSQFNLVGINQADILGFQNDDTVNPNPTQVTVTYSGGAEAARTAGCTINDASNTIISAPTLTKESSSSKALSGSPDSILGQLNCTSSAVPSATYTADIKIQFTAGGKSYTTTTTLTATKP